MSLWRRVPAPPSSARAFSTSSRGTWAVGTPGGLFFGFGRHAWGARLGGPGRAAFLGLERGAVTQARPWICFSGGALGAVGAGRNQRRVLGGVQKRWSCAGPGKAPGWQSRQILDCLSPALLRGFF